MCEKVCKNCKWFNKRHLLDIDLFVYYGENTFYSYNPELRQKNSDDFCSKFEEKRVDKPNSEKPEPRLDPLRVVFKDSKSEALKYSEKYKEDKEWCDNCKYCDVVEKSLKFGINLTSKVKGTVKCYKWGSIEFDWNSWHECLKCRCYERKNKAL